MEEKSVLVIFTDTLPKKDAEWWKKFNRVVAPSKLHKEISVYNNELASLEEYVGGESIYEANVLAEELSLLTLPNGQRISKSFSYKGYDLWWFNYDTLFFYFCLPYTQYKKLLIYLKSFQHVYLYKPDFHRLFSTYLSAHECGLTIDTGPGVKNLTLLPVGVFFQILLTLISLPVLMLKRSPIMIYTGDEFDKGKDHNFRMKFVYEEMRRRKTPFIEFIRSVESWKTLLGHAFTRKRPVVYTDAITFLGLYMSILTGGRARAGKLFGPHTFESVTDNDERFKYMVATYYLQRVYEDVWAIRIMKLILKGIGVKAAFMLVATGRNLQTTLGCKLNAIETIGVLHGVASRHYNLYEFMPAYDGEKVLSVDKYGLWSEWWKEYFMKNSKAYRKEQLYVSGPMRPLEPHQNDGKAITSHNDRLRVLFVSELVAVPGEVMPYLHELMDQKDIELTIKFRPHHDTFEEWLSRNEPQILQSPSIRIVNGSMHEAIQESDVVTGCQSTGVLEALLQNKVPNFFRTQKWGDYYSMTEEEDTQCLFAESPEELILKLTQAKDIQDSLLVKLCARYFGNPSVNGSAWAVDQLEEIIKRK